MGYRRVLFLTDLKVPTVTVSRHQQQPQKQQQQQPEDAASCNIFALSADGILLASRW